jgi:hypothetical protein
MAHQGDDAPIKLGFWRCALRMRSSSAATLNHFGVKRRLPPWRDGQALGIPGLSSYRLHIEARRQDVVGCLGVDVSV